MKKCVVLSLAVLAALVAFCGCGAKNDPLESRDLAALEGKWHLVRMREKGVSVPRKEVQQYFRVFKGKELLFLKGDEILVKATYSLRPSNSPKEIDQKFDGPGGQVGLGIYEIRENTLVTCMGTETERPTQFTSSSDPDDEDHDWIVAEFERVVTPND